MISAIFDLQVTPILPFKCQANGPFYSEDEVQNRFSRWQLWGHKLLAIFDLQVASMILIKFQVNWPFFSGKKGKIDFQDGHHLGFPNVTI